MTHSRPITRPIPVMMPAAWISPSYMPLAASGESSRNGEPGSISRSTRSRGRSLPRSVWRLRLFSSPPSAARAIFSFRSATSFPIASALALNAGELGEVVDLICGIDSLGRQHTQKGVRPYFCLPAHGHKVAGLLGEDFNEHPRIALYRSGKRSALGGGTDDKSIPA